MVETGGRTALVDSGNFRNIIIVEALMKKGSLITLMGSVHNLASEAFVMEWDIITPEDTKINRNITRTMDIFVKDRRMHFKRDTENAEHIFIDKSTI